MPTYVVLADVDGREFQNVQELSAILGEVRAEIDDLGGAPRESYVLMGGFDFLVSFDADDDEAALAIAIGIERYGLDTRTMPALEMEKLGGLVDDY